MEDQKEELRQKIDDAKSQEELDSIAEEVRNLEEIEEVENLEETPVEETEEKEEERNIVNEELFQQVEERSIKNFKVIEKEKTKMEEKRTLSQVLESKEYRSAWAKSLMLRKDLTEQEKTVLNEFRTLGGITTTATDFVAPTADAMGINNAGLFIPETVSLEILKEIEMTSPFLADVAKTRIKGIVAFPYKKSSTGAKFVKEGTDTVPESDEYAKLVIDGREISKTITLTWKVQEMAVEDFISYLVTEIAREMGEELASKVLYGAGDDIEVKGATKDALTATGGDALAGIEAGLNKISKREKRLVKIYLSEAQAHAISFEKDTNGAYIHNPVNGVAIQSIGTYKVEVDPFLEDTHILIGNPQNYRLNYNTDLDITRDVKGRERITDFTGYQVVGGAPIPEKFVLVNIANG